MISMADNHNYGKLTITYILSSITGLGISQTIVQPSLLHTQDETRWLDHRVAITLEKSLRKNICLEKDQHNEMPVQWKICLEVIGW